MPTSRRTFTPEEKARVVLEILREEKSISQLASEEGIHPNVLNRWKNEATQNLAQLFVDDRKGVTKMKKEYEQQIEDLYAEVSKLTTQLSWLKKIWPIISAETNGGSSSNGRAQNFPCKHSPAYSASIVPACTTNRSLLPQRKFASSTELTSYTPAIPFWATGRSRP